MALNLTGIGFHQVVLYQITDGKISHIDSMRRVVDLDDDGTPSEVWDRGDRFICDKKLQLSAAEETYAQVYKEFGVLDVGMKGSSSGVKLIQTLDGKTIPVKVGP